MFSQTSEYALRAMVCLANSEDQQMTTRQIAERTQVPPNYLSKVLLSLVRAGLVRSQRGLHGGSLLAREPENITMLEVINAVEPLHHIHQCPLDLKQHQKKLCPLHRRLENAVCMIEEAFGSTTLADLLSGDSQIKPLCDVTAGEGAGPPGS